MRISPFSRFLSLRTNGSSKLTLNSLKWCSSIAKIISHDRFNEVLEIEYKDDKNKFGLRWLRDHCRCSECLDQRTFQRLYDTSKIMGDFEPKKVEIDTNTNQLKLKWRDGHSSSFRVDWLNEISKTSSETTQYEALLDYKLWKNKSFKQQYPEISYNQVMSGNGGVSKWIEMIKQFGFAIVGGCPELPIGDTRSSREVMEKLGALKRTFFEPEGVWDFTVEPKGNETKMEHADTAYTNLTLPPHVDGTYFSEAPGLQFFQIPQHHGEGGETILVDGFQIGNYLELHAPELFNYLSSFPMPFHYYEKGISLRNTSTVFSMHKNKFLQFTFNNNDRMPCYIPVDQERYHYDAITWLIRALNSEENQISFKLRPDQLLVTNNWRVLHGRKGFTGTRRLVGAYIGMSDFLGTARMIHSVPPEAQKQ